MKSILVWLIAFNYFEISYFSYISSTLLDKETAKESSNLINLAYHCVYCDSESNSLWRLKNMFFFLLDKKKKLRRISKICDKRIRTTQKRLESFASFCRGFCKNYNSLKQLTNWPIIFKLQLLSLMRYYYSYI